MKACYLQYPNKAPLEAIQAYKASGRLLQEIQSESVDAGCFYFGDNLPILHLLKEDYANKVDLIYIDPPFGTGQAFSNQDSAIAYTDQQADSNFLEFLRWRLYAMYDLLSSQGTIYLHIDKKVGHYVKMIMDEVFGYENFLNDLTRIKCNPKNFSRKAYGNFSDMILVYAKNRDQHIWHPVREALKADEIRQLFPKQDQNDGKAYTTHPLHAPGETVDGDTGMVWRGLHPPKGRHWRYSRKVLDELDAQGLIEWSPTGNPRKKVFAKDHQGKKVQDVWTFKDRGMSYVSYPTQKNHDLLRRILAHSTHPDSLVLDAFAGSGALLQVAHQMGRKWLGIDESEISLEVVQENFQRQDIPYHLFHYQPS